MMSRDTKGVQPGITLRMAAHHDHRAVKRDVATFIKGHQTCGHGIEFLIPGLVTPNDGPDESRLGVGAARVTTYLHYNRSPARDDRIDAFPISRNPTFAPTARSSVPSATERSPIRASFLTEQLGSHNPKLAIFVKFRRRKTTLSHAHTIPYAYGNVFHANAEPITPRIDSDRKTSTLNAPCGEAHDPLFDRISANHVAVHREPSPVLHDSVAKLGNYRDRGCAKASRTPYLIAERNRILKERNVRNRCSFKIIGTPTRSIPGNPPYRPTERN